MLDFWQTIKDRVQGKAEKGQKRSSKWRKVRKEHLKKNPRCYVCGMNKKIEVHHIIAFQLAPDQELNPENLITLCEAGKWGITCHRLIGHLGTYQRINPNVKIDAMTWRMKLGKVKS